MERQTHHQRVFGGPGIRVGSGLDSLSAQQQRDPLEEALACFAGGGLLASAFPLSLVFLMSLLQSFSFGSKNYRQSGCSQVLEFPGPALRDSSSFW